MAIKDTFKTMRELLSQIIHDLEKSEKGNKAASQRVRTGTVKLEKVAKLYRKESIKNEKATKGQKKAPAKKATKSKTASKSHAQHGSHHGSAAKTAKVKAKPKAKSHKSTARPRPLSLKKPSAKLPKKSHRR